jgi:hypothetical protein
MGVAFAQAASSSLPSIVIPPETDAAVAVGRDVEAAGAVCALNLPALAIRKNAAATLTE